MAIESEKPEIDYIRYLKNNLLDSYKYGDGFTIFKELIQNASDAEADTLKVYVIDSLKNAKCSEALRTPAIVVYDHGKFDDTNKDGIKKIASDNKTSETSKIGRYGLGMKSIFHICDFFIYAANTKDFPYKTVYPMNYWPDDDERFKSFSDEDIELVLNSLPKDVDIRKNEGFLLYIPIKIKKENWKNIISNDINPYPFGSYNSLKKRLPICLALLSEVAPQKSNKPQGQTLKSILYSQANDTFDICIQNDKTKIKTIIDTQTKKPVIHFISYKPEKIAEEVLNVIKRLKQNKREYWTEEQKKNLIPELCFELIREDKENKEKKAKLKIDFCVYLPLEEDYCSKSFEIESKYNYTILIHSNFAVDSGRRGIRGFGDLLDEATEAGIDSEEGVQKLWNKYIAQMVLFPNLPLFLNEVKELIKDHNDFCEITNKLYNTCFSYNEKNIRLCNDFTTNKYGFANLYETGWSSFELIKDKSNYIFLPYSKDEKEIQKLFPIVKDKKSKFILKTPDQKFILPDLYKPDELFLAEVIQNIPVIGLLEERYIVAFTQFIDYQKEIISSSFNLQTVLINHIKTLLAGLSFDDLSKNQTKLSELFRTINEATADSSYKVYSIGQKEKIDFLKLYTLEDFKTFWKKESKFIFVPGFIRIENEFLPKIREYVFEDKDNICDFINVEDNCRGELHYNIISSLLGGDTQCTHYLKSIAEKYDTLQIFRVNNASLNEKKENLNYRLIKDLIFEKKIFMTQSNPSNKETVFYYYVKTIAPIDIYHINNKIREAAGFTEHEIPSADDARSIFDSFSKLYYDSKKQTVDNNYEIKLDVKNDYWEQLLDEGFKKTYEIVENEKEFYRFLFSGFDKELRNEPLATFDKDVPDVWKEVYKNIEPNAKKIPPTIPARAKDQIEKNKNILNIEPEPLNKNRCRDKLRIYANNNDLSFFKAAYFQNKEIQKQLFENFTDTEKDLYKAIPVHINAETGELTKATGRSFLNTDEIIFPADCKLQLKLIKISDDPDLAYHQNRFIDNLTIKEAIKEALSTKEPETDISQWVFEKMRIGGTKWKDIFENSTDGHRYFSWIPLKTGKNKKFCDIQEILNDDIFSTDSREWIAEHYEMYNLTDLNISDTSFLKSKKLIAETVNEQLEYIGRKVDKTLSVKLSYSETETNTLFSDFMILKDFKYEPIFGLVNILKQERKEKTKEIFDFYSLRRLSNSYSKKDIYTKIINYICDKQEVNQTTLSLYEKLLGLLLEEDNFDITSIKYPTQNNEWNSAESLAASNSSSISQKFLMNNKIYKILTGYNLIRNYNYEFQDKNSDEILITDSSDITLIKNTFSIWETCLDKKRLLYLFFYLLKGNFKKIAIEPSKLHEKDLLPLTKDLRYEAVPRNKKYILSKTGTLAEWWNSGYTKDEAVMDINSKDNQFEIRIHISKGKQSMVHSLTGTILLVDIVDGNDIYIEQPSCEYPNIFHIPLIDTTQKIKNIDEKIEKLIFSVWKEIYQQTSEAEFNKMIHNFKESNQNTIKTAQLFMFENLIIHLKDLNLSHPFFKHIFKEYNNLLNEKARKENAGEEFPEYVKKKDNLSKKLIEFITSDEVEADYFVEEIFDCVVKKIDQAKYDQSRILFELLQNADDAVKDLAENGESIEGRTKFEVIDVNSKVTSRPSIHTSHFGRLINESLSKEKEDIYSNDLLNMLLINSSEKEESSTGKFGLGFKSVYFVCQEPIIRSGDLHFKILGALYPENEESDSLRPNETRIELTLNNHAESDVIYGDFEKNAELQALFCKYIDELSIRGTRYKPELQEGSKQCIGLYYTDNNKYLRFALKTGTLVFRLSKDSECVESFGERSVSRVWNLTPLATAKTLPFAINCPFEVDIGRKNLDENNLKNESLLIELSIELSNEIAKIVEKNNETFCKYIPSLLNMFLDGCGIYDSGILNTFCKNVLKSIYEKTNIVPDGIGGIIQQPGNPYYIAPNRFNLEYGSSRFYDFISRLKAIISDKAIVTRNVAEALDKTVLDFNEIASTEEILKIITGDSLINNDKAESFMDLVALLPNGLPTNFGWDNFKVIDIDGDYENVREVTRSGTFANDYSQFVIDFFNKHITFVSFNHDNRNLPSSPYFGNAEDFETFEPINYPRCTVIEVYNKWKKSVETGNWNWERQKYYNKVFPTSLADTTSRQKSLAISADFFENYSEDKKTMPESWCTLFMLGSLQSINYFGEQRTEVSRKEKMESMSGLIKEFSEGETLDRLYDHYLDSHPLNEDDLLEFESLLRVYKFRRQFMDIWSNFHGLKYSKEISKETLINTSASAEATGKALKIYCSKKTLKFGISLIVRELLDSDFYGTTDEERDKAFDILNQFTYIPHAYLRRIAFNDWSESPVERTSEAIHYAILEALRAEDLSENEIRAFMKCHDLPFLIFGEKK